MTGPVESEACVLHQFLPEISWVGEVSIPDLGPEAFQVLKALLDGSTSRGIRIRSDGRGDRMSIPPQPGIGRFVLFHFFGPSSKSVVIGSISDLFQAPLNVNDISGNSQLRFKMRACLDTFPELVQLFPLGEGQRGQIPKSLNLMQACQQPTQNPFSVSSKVPCS